MSLPPTQVPLVDPRSTIRALPPSTVRDACRRETPNLASSTLTVKKGPQSDPLGLSPKHNLRVVGDGDQIGANPDAGSVSGSDENWSHGRSHWLVSLPKLPGTSPEGAALWAHAGDSGEWSAAAWCGAL